jgi:FG-GAP repeat
MDTWRGGFTTVALATSMIMVNQAGAQTIVSLPPTPAGLSVVEFNGEAIDDNFGIGLGSAGDVNGDGIPDLIVGAPFNDAGAMDGGAAYIYLGGGAAGTAWDYRLTAEAINDQLGTSVAGIGDFDMDGFDDVAVGARWSDRTGLLDQGATTIVFGSDMALGTRTLIIDGIGSAAAGMGHSVAGGDFNGDGYADLVAGAPFDTNSPTNIQAGRVDLFFGGPAPDAGSDRTFLGEAGGHQFGWSVDSAGDVNNDGFDDLIVGARWFGSFPNTAKGKAYIYFGGINMDTAADVELTGGSADNWLGYSVTGAGDVNNDGFDDVAISEPLFPNGGGTGRVQILFGGMNMDNIPDLILDGVAGDDQFGWSVDGGMDLNNDGFDDLVVGARFSDAAASNSGTAYVYYGGASMDNLPDIIVGSANADDALGTTVAMLGDWQNNGTPLAAASAVWHDNGALTDTAVGAVFAFGTSIALDGDLDGDGFVGIADLNIVLGNWNQNVPPGDPLADPTGDGFVGIADLNIVLGNWNAGTPPSDATAAIPEPTPLTLLILGISTLLYRHNTRGTPK